MHCDVCQCKQIRFLRRVQRRACVSGTRREGASDAERGSHLARRGALRVLRMLSGPLRVNRPRERAARRRPASVLKLSDLQTGDCATRSAQSPCEPAKGKRRFAAGGACCTLRARSPGVALTARTSSGARTRTFGDPAACARELCTHCESLRVYMVGRYGSSVPFCDTFFKRLSRSRQGPARRTRKVRGAGSKHDALLGRIAACICDS